MDIATYLELDYNLILLVEDECGESLDSVPLRNFFVLSGVNLGEVSGWILCAELRGSSSVLWCKFLAVAAKQVN